MTLKPKRRLAAIFVADVFEFSRMMAEDEAGTLTRILDQQKTVITPEINRHDGRVIKLMGDGVLAVFPSVISAVEAAAAIQRRANADPDPNRLKLRIGLNLGEVMIADHDIYGDGVNVASRIEALARPGGVAMSAAAYDQLRNKIPYEFEDCGLHKVKNIPEPVQVYFLGKELAEIPKLNLSVLPKKSATTGSGKVIFAASGLVAVMLLGLAGYWWLPGLGASGSLSGASPVAIAQGDRPRIAVRAFTDSVGAADGGGLAIGLAEGVIARLAQVPNLTVIAPHSSLAQSDLSDHSLGQQLGADYVVSGRIDRRDGLAVSLDILDLHTALQSLVGVPSHSQQDVLALQSAVVRDLLIHLPVPDKEAQFRSLAVDATDNSDAYLQLIRARSHLREGRPAEGKQALQQALVLDPDLGEARGLLAMAHMDLFSGKLEGMTGRISEAKLMLSSGATSRQERQVEIISTLLEDDVPSALSQARDLQADYPNYADGHALLAWLLIFAGELDEAAESLDFAKTLNPFPPATYYAIEAELLFAAGQDDAALAAADRAIAMDPSAQRVRLFRVAALANSGGFDEAAAELVVIAKRDRGVGLQEAADLLPYTAPEARQRVLIGLRLAGL
ncbi:hypothetical protein A9Q94_09830 [Rhodobacterales bacterium 56_14_T64]|nr:hypothetical protein A9Q94_09830 [Rhodobacterales bacterium 56_14_T64]